MACLQNLTVRLSIGQFQMVVKSAALERPTASFKSLPPWIKYDPLRKQTPPDPDGEPARSACDTRTATVGISWLQGLPSIECAVTLPRAQPEPVSPDRNDSRPRRCRCASLNRKMKLKRC